MRYSVSLRPDHQRALAIMSHAGDPLSEAEIDYLRRAYAALESDATTSVKYFLSIRPLHITGSQLFSTREPPQLRIPPTSRVLSDLCSFGLIEESDRLGLAATSRTNVYSLTEEGERIAERIIKRRILLLRPRAEEQRHIFVASAFGHPEFDALYESEIVPACEAAGYVPYRVDLTEPSAAITAAIIEHITGARAMIADLTAARPSVYFEVGVAHGLGVPLLLTCRRDHYRGSSDSARVHFDLEQYKISFWRRAQKRFIWGKGMAPINRLATLLRT